MQPLISVVIPVFNGCATIERAIDSVFRQTYENYEIIVVDDGSTDSSKEVLHKYETRIHLLEEVNAGATVARNSGAKLASGRYLAFLDQDDWWVPQKLAIQVRALEKRSSLGLVFGNLHAVDPSGNMLGFMTNQESNCHSPSLEELLLIFPVYPSAATLRKDLFDSVGGFDTRFGLSGAYGDQDLHIRLRKLASFQFTSPAAGFYGRGRLWESPPQRIRSFLANLPTFAAKYYDHPFMLNTADGRLQEKFVLRCAENLNELARWLLKSCGNCAGPELLIELNGYYNQFKTIFGNSFLMVAGQDSLRLSKYNLDTPISTLLLLFLYRPNLQARFPEVFQGDLSRLIEWGYSVSTGAERDVDHNVLSPFDQYLESVPSGRSNYTPKRDEFDSYAAEVGKDLSNVELRMMILEKEKTIVDLDRQLRIAVSELRRINQSLGHRLLRRFYSRIDRTFPDRTLRGEMRISITACFRTMAEEGIKVFLAKASEKIKRGELLVKQIEGENCQTKKM